MKNRRTLSLKYMFSDFLSAAISWVCFYYFRKTAIESSEFITDNNFFLGLLIIPFFPVFHSSLEYTELAAKSGIEFGRVKLCQWSLILISITHVQA